MMPVFAGRSAELDTLSRVLSSSSGTAVITAIGGTAGVGKTALALHWGHLVAAEFPDGQLYVNLNGFGPSGAPVSAAGAVRVLLEGLDVPAERVPHSEDGQLNLYRSLLAGKRMLIVLDNARDEAQVRPLLPGALTCRVVVTSRNLLAGLTALDAAYPLRLDVLSEADAWDLLEQRLGAKRLHADDGATHQIIKASACLPLALSIVADRAVERPDLAITDIAAESLREYARELGRNSGGRRRHTRVLPSGMSRFALVRGGAGPGLLLGAVLGLLALGPGLKGGFLLSYDMVFVPREAFRAALPGLAPPRAVPSDLVVAVGSRVLPADIVQKAVLVAIFVLACGGVAALLDREPQLARLSAGAFYAWNPYVGERLIIGQWALLLGYAGLPWVLRALLRQGKSLRNWAGWLCLSLLPAVAGGFESMAITGLVMLPVLLSGRDVRKIVTGLAVFVAGCLPWLIPSLLHAVYVDPASVAAFAARADTPFGSVGSLVMLGGIWDSATVPKAYGGTASAIWLAIVIAALAGYLARARWQRAGPADVAASQKTTKRWPGLGVAAVIGLLIAGAGITAPGRDLLRWLIGAVPGIAVVRDGQQFVAPLALLEALGAGVAVAWAMKRPGGMDAAGAMIGVFALLAPVVLLPGLAWGAAGRLRAVNYPATWLAAATKINDSPQAGAVLVLPWAADRTPAWNHGETMLDPWPRLLSRPVIWNDGTVVGHVALAPDDPKARALDALIGGGGPLTRDLTSAGVRFVVNDPDGPGQQIGERLPGAVVVVSQPGLTVYRLP
jgi:hypothetical protein